MNLKQLYRLYLSDPSKLKSAVNLISEEDKNLINSYDYGGKISDKIRKLVTEENIPQKQAVAIAYSMRDRDELAKGGGLSRKKDYGSKKKPYPSVKSKDFAGGGRSYPIPSRADAVDALRLAGLHGRSDVKAKVYKKYPGLKKKEFGGAIDNNLDNTTIYETGGSHNSNPMGGIPLSNNALVEENEVRFDLDDGQSYIFSDKISYKRK
jgi:hypothetical protein